jgi:hypothetical protein
MSLVTISADLPNIDNVLRSVNDAAGGKGLKFTSEAVRDSMNIVQRTWIQYASGVNVTYSGGTFRINSVSGAYLRSLEDGIRFIDDLSGEVFSNSPYGHWIESGTQPRDMKEKLLSSPKAKTGKDGKRYITVAFRHGAPGTTTMPAMPQSVYKDAKQLGYSRRGNGLGSTKHEWGGRLGANATGQRSHIPPHPGGSGADGAKGYTWKSGLYTGMVKVGQANHSQYMTFRRVSDNSDPRSWMFPGTKPKPIREAVAENTREEVLQLIRRGFEMDLYFMGLGGD